MKYELIKPIEPTLSPTQQVLWNRGIKSEDFDRYINTTDEDINSPLLFGEDNLREGAKIIVSAAQNNEPTLVIVDCDCDGYTSAALLLNYLHDLFPSFVEKNVSFFLHDSKQHGLSDCIDIAMEYKNVLIPDAGSNDYDYHKQLKDNGTNILIMDHHEAPYLSEDAITINNQLSD